MRIDWDLVALDGTDYTVDRRTYGNDDSWETVGRAYDDTVDEGYFVDTDDELEPDRVYEYRVVAIHSQWGDATSESRTIETAEFPAPEISHAIPGVGSDVEKIYVEWYPVAYNGREIQYQIYRAESAPDASSSFTSLSAGEWQYVSSYISMDGGSQYRYVDGNVTTDRSFYYIVKAHTSTYDDRTVVSASEYARGYAGDTDPGEPGDGIPGTWSDLGAAGFASAAGPVSLVSHGNALYLAYADSDDTDQRLTLRSHTGAPGVGWQPLSGDAYVSAGAIAPTLSPEAMLFSDGSSLLVAFAEAASAGDSNGRLFVKAYSSGWNTTGDPDGVSYWDAAFLQAYGRFGSRAQLFTQGSDLGLVYLSESGGLVGSLSYSGSGDYWELLDDGYWFDNTLSSTEIAAATDTTGAPVVAVETGGISDPEVSFHRYNGSWATWASPYAPAAGFPMLEIEDLLFISGTSYLACLEYDAGGYASAAIVAWDEGAWSETGLESELTTPGTVTDLAVSANAAGTGLLAAVSYRDETDTSLYRVELWQYAVGRWSQLGDTLEPSVGVDRIALAVDADSQAPVVAFAETSSGDIHAKVFVAD